MIENFAQGLKLLRRRLIFNKGVPDKMDHCFLGAGPKY